MAKRSITVAALQASYGEDMAANIRKPDTLVREAVARGANAILPSELFQGPYFCVSQEERWFDTAYPWAEHPCVLAMQPLAAELGVALPVSTFEREGPHYFNSMVMVDADGRALGVYRKSHIPDGPGYQEKYYFRPGDTGFRVWDTRFGRVGVGICWDQWYPEAARAMALMGAEVLLYPTAIGSEPHDPTLDTAAPSRPASSSPAPTIPVSPRPGRPSRRPRRSSRWVSTSIATWHCAPPWGRALSSKARSRLRGARRNASS